MVQRLQTAWRELALADTLYKLDKFEVVARPSSDG